MIHPVDLLDDLPRFQSGVLGRRTRNGLPDCRRTQTPCHQQPEWRSRLEEPPIVVGPPGRHCGRPGIDRLNQTGIETESQHFVVEFVDILVLYQMHNLGQDAKRAEEVFPVFVVETCAQKTGEKDYADDRQAEKNYAESCHVTFLR